MRITELAPPRSSVGHDTRRRALWGVGLIAGAAVTTVVAVALASVLACSPTSKNTAGVVAASPAPLTLPIGPPPPAAGLAMPPLEFEWRPPSAAAGDVDALALALAKHPRVGLLVDASVDASKLDPMRLTGLIAQLAPDTAVHPLANSGAERLALADVIREDPPLLPSTAASGRTQWAVDPELGLDDARLHAWAKQGDPAVLVIGAVGIDTPVWRQLSTAAVGSCEPLFDALLQGQAESLAQLEGFLDHADEVLARAYMTELAPVVPALQAELAEFEHERERKDFDGQSWARYQCGRRYLQYLQPFAACVAAGRVDACPASPRMFLQGAARIGSSEPSDYIPNDCARRLERDYVEALREPARAAAELASDYLDGRWMLLAERLATLTELHAALTELCTAKRRRFADPDIEQLHASVAELAALFMRSETPPSDARFLANDGSFHVPGLGRVRQLARYDGGTGSASRELIAKAKQLLAFERSHARCVARPGDAPLMLMLIDTATATPEFLGFYYAEELWCEDLGAL